MDLKQFKLDKKAEKEGIWVEIGDGAKIKVARLGNPAYQGAIRRMGKPFARQMRHGGVDTDVLEGITRRAMARHILLDWEGLEVDGEAVEYSEKNALKLLTDYSAFYDLVSECAADNELFRADAQEEARGN